MNACLVLSKTMMNLITFKLSINQRPTNIFSAIYLFIFLTASLFSWSCDICHFSNKECPTCRKKLVSKRSLRPDPNFDALISKFTIQYIIWLLTVEKQWRSCVKFTASHYVMQILH